MKFLINPTVTGTVMFVMCRQRVKWFSPTVVNPGCECGMNKCDHTEVAQNKFTHKKRETWRNTQCQIPVFFVTLWEPRTSGKFFMTPKKTLQGNFSWHQKKNTKLSVWFASLLTNFSSLSYFCLLLARALWHFIDSIKPTTHVWQGALDDSWV